MDPNAILALLGDLYTQLSRANAALDARNQQWADPEALRERVAEVEKAILQSSLQTAAEKSAAPGPPTADPPEVPAPEAAPG